MENLDANGHNAAETQNQVRTRAANPQIERRNRSEVPMSQLTGVDVDDEVAKTAGRKSPGHESRCKVM